MVIDIIKMFFYKISIFQFIILLKRVHIKNRKRFKQIDLVLVKILALNNVKVKLVRSKEKLEVTMKLLV